MEAVARAKMFDSTAPPSASSLATIAQNGFRINPWQPGLLQMQVGGRVSDLFGLGDIVFPSMLVGWSLREDRIMNEEETRAIAAGAEGSRKSRFKLSLMEEDSSEFLNKAAKDRGNSPQNFNTSIVCYILGCFLCEIFQTGAGQPALVYITPVMLLGLAWSTLQGNLQQEGKER